MIQSISPILSRSITLRCAFSVGIFAVALAIRWALLPLHGSVAFATFYPATLLAFLLCGTGPGFITVALSLVAGIYISSDANWSWNIGRTGVVSATAYFVSSVIIAWMVGRLQTTFKSLRTALQQLDRTSSDLQDLYDYTPGAYYSLDADGRLIQSNVVLRDWLGFSSEESVCGRKITDFFTDEGKASFAKNFPIFLATGRIGPLEFDLICGDGQKRRVVVSATGVFDDNGRLLKSRSAMYDISELDHARRELQRLNREQTAMLDNELIGIVKLRDRRAIWRNRALERMFGYSPGELDDRPARILYRDDDSYRSLGEAAYPVLRQGGKFRTQMPMARKDGETIWVDMSGVLLSEATDESMWLMQDITALKERQAQVEAIAFHDSMTGLANRVLLEDRLRQAVLLNDRLKVMLAICFIDLDDFKVVNDTFGHDAGDRVLREVARRLLHEVRETDTVARLGGDEFVVVLTPLHSPEESKGVVDRIGAAISNSILVTDSKSVQVSASIGVAFSPENGATLDTLLAHADRKMYEAKHLKKRAQPKLRRAR